MILAVQYPITYEKTHITGTQVLPRANCTPRISGTIGKQGLLCYEHSCLNPIKCAGLSNAIYMTLVISTSLISK